MILLSLAMLLQAAAPPGQPAPAVEPMRLSPWVYEKLDEYALQVVHSDHRYLVLHVEFDGPRDLEQFREPGAHLFHRFGRFGDIFVPAGDKDAVKRLARRPGVSWIDLGGEIRVPPPPPPPPKIGPALGGRTEEIIRGGVGKLTGAGVAIVIIDTGLDFRHDDFITLDALGRPVSRLLYYWDALEPWDPAAVAGRPAPVRYPDDQPIGTIYSQPELTAELRRPPGERTILTQPDRDGHGTQCAGIAAGNGRAARKAGVPGNYAGVAPDAHLIAVRIGDGSLPIAFLLNTIIGWAERTLPGTPLVVSCSFGGQLLSGKDGYSVTERQLDARLDPDRTGAVVCVAAGNEGAHRLHASRSLEPGKSWELTWQTTDEARLVIYAPGARTGGLRGSAPGPVVIAFKEYVHPLADALILETSVKQPGSCTLTNGSGRRLDLDAYVLSASPLPTATTQFANSVLVVQNEHQIASPASSQRVITVGSYDFNDVITLPGQAARQVEASNGTPMIVGDRSDYSNAGYLRRRDVVKPDCLAPGQWHVTTLPTTSNDPYGVFCGTSAATPYLAGTLALLLQKEPKLTRGQVRTALRSALTPRPAQRPNLPPPNRFWGHGKLDRDAVRRLFPSEFVEKQ
jgi:minor extracellular serine protease Vpr